MEDKEEAAVAEAEADSSAVATAEVVRACTSSLLLEEIPPPPPPSHSPSSVEQAITRRRVRQLPPYLSPSLLTLALNSLRNALFHVYTSRFNPGNVASRNATARLRGSTNPRSPNVPGPLSPSPPPPPPPCPQPAMACQAAVSAAGMCSRRLRAKNIKSTGEVVS